MKKLMLLMSVFLMIGCSTGGQLEGTWRYVEYDFTTTKSQNGELLETLKGVLTYPISQQQNLTLNPNGTCLGLFNGYWLLVDNTLKIKDSIQSKSFDNYTIKYLSDTKLILESSSVVETDSLIYETATTHYFEH